jgi:hypothetical protein
MEHEAQRREEQWRESEEPWQEERHSDKEACEMQMAGLDAYNREVDKTADTFDADTLGDAFQRA